MTKAEIIRTLKGIKTRISVRSELKAMKKYDSWRTNS